MLKALLERMQPRNRSSAMRTIVTLTGVAAVVTIAFAPIQRGDRDLTTTEAVTVTITVLVVFVACWLARLHPTLSMLAWAVGPLLTVAAIVWIDFLTKDTSVAAQIFFFFPTLYAASQLRPAGAWTIVAASVVGEAFVVFSQLPLRDASVDFGYVAASLVTTAALLIRSEARRAELIAELERQAAIDSLTGLVTRRVLDEAAQSAMSGAASVEGTSLIVLDVDNFKTINDRYGHPAGDDILVQLAEVLVRSARPDDVVSRLGGDEIAMLLPGCSLATLRARAEQIVRDVRAHRFTIAPSREVPVSVSAGLAHAPSQALDLHTLYATADAALYEAKRSGRDRVGVPADQAGTGHGPAHDVS